MFVSVYVCVFFFMAVWQFLNRIAMSKANKNGVYCFILVASFFLPYFPLLLAPWLRSTSLEIKVKSKGEISVICAHYNQKAKLLTHTHTGSLAHSRHLTHTHINALRVLLVIFIKRL